MIEKKFGFENLEVYQKAVKYSNDVEKMILKFPKYEYKNLIDQYRRATTSVTHNIAEGYGKFHKKEKIRFYNHARSSIFECVSALNNSLERRYIDEFTYMKLYDESHSIAQMLSKLIQSIYSRNF